MTIERVHAGGGSLTRPRENDHANQLKRSVDCAKKTPGEICRGRFEF